MVFFPQPHPRKVGRTLVGSTAELLPAEAEDEQSDSDANHRTEDYESGTAEARNCPSDESLC